MRITIEHSKTKRRIDGIFHICEHRSDIEILARQLMVKLEEPDWYYGWVTIKTPDKPPVKLGPPVEWDCEHD